MTRTETIDVDFTVDCEDFAVPEWTDLRCSATFRVLGTVELDHSGDHITPDGPPSPDVLLIDPTEYEIAVCAGGVYSPLPQWLQELLAMDRAQEFDDAFLTAIGGQDRLNELAIEKAL